MIAFSASPLSYSENPKAAGSKLQLEGSHLGFRHFNVAHLGVSLLLQVSSHLIVPLLLQDTLLSFCKRLRATFSKSGFDGHGHKPFL